MEELETEEVSGADGFALAPDACASSRLIEGDLDVTVTIETAMRIRFQKVKRSWELER